MEKQKKFKKQELKHEDFEVMEQGAKAVKGVLGLAVVIGVVAKNKENLKHSEKVLLNLRSRLLSCKGCTVWTKAKSVLNGILNPF